MDADVLIVGAGPAGMSAARAFDGSGMHVVVIERMSDGAFSRYHSVCGEAVSDRMFEINGISSDHVMAEVDGIEIRLGDGPGIRIPNPGKVVDRSRMLLDMRDGCGASFIRGTVKSVRHEGRSFVAETTEGEIRCRYVIGADGAHSVVRRDLFGTDPVGSVPLVNTVCPGESGRYLEFVVGSQYEGVYAWRFPSKPGYVSVGFPKGFPVPDDAMSRGARVLPFGGVPDAVSGNAMLVGDAAGMANALCYGGIGVAMLSGRLAAEAVIRGKPGSYGRWCRRSIYSKQGFVRAREKFAGWSDEEILAAARPLSGRYSVMRGAYAMIRRPRYAGVYFAAWLALRYGW